MVKIAILGFGTVGSGVYEIIKNNAVNISKKAGQEIEIKYILDIRDFSSHPESHLFTNDFTKILKDDEVGVVVETMGGLHPAYEFTKSSLEAGKNAVTSNKELVATYGPELLEIAYDNNVNYLFEASVGGGIPIIRPIHQCLAANNIKRITGILNGTTNYILTQMFREGKSFDDALSDAQEKGYAERNPAADVEGFDACRKIAILSSLASGRQVDYNKIPTEGITKVTLEDVKAAGSMGYSIKLIGYADINENSEVFARVSPMAVPNYHMLASVEDVFNAIMVRGDSVSDVMFYGKGAGKLPTASAVVADVIDSVKHLQKSKRIMWNDTDPDNMISRHCIEGSFIVRTLKDTDTVLSVMPDAVVRTGDNEQNTEETVFITPVGLEDDIEALVNEVGGIISRIRILPE
ncbi:MAG: homoserine dehydrogenase [Oscillospiraceae bacterium]|nr:homoserine dehydrogenase [Oscillospiraceae bacterium]